MLAVIKEIIIIMGTFCYADDISLLSPTVSCRFTSYVKNILTLS